MSRKDAAPAVLMLTNAVAPDKLGGLERYVRELSAQLIRCGCSVTVITKKVHGDEADEEQGPDGVKILRHKVPSKQNPFFPLLYPLQVAGAVGRALRRNPNAVVHAHYAITATPLVVQRRPFVYTFHAPVHKEILSERQDSYWLPKTTQRLAVSGVRSAERRVILRATATAVLSEFMGDELTRLARPASRRAHLIPGGIDTDWFSPGRRDDLWQGASPLLVCARRLTPRTGVRELVLAMPSVLSALPNARLVVAGEGAERHAIEAAVKTHGLSAAVRLLGRIGDNELRSWYRAADLVVVPTQELEGFGLATGEALACGTPALVTPAGANPELVGPLDLRLIAAGTSSSDLAGGIVRLGRSTELLAQLRQSCRDRAHPSWSWSKVAEDYLRLYEAVSSVRGPSLMSTQ